MESPYQFILCCCHSSQPFQAGRNQFLVLDPLQDRKALLVEVTCRHVVTPHRGNARQANERLGHARLIPGLLEGASALLEEVRYLCRLSLLEHDLPQEDERVGSFPGTGDLLKQG